MWRHDDTPRPSHRPRPWSGRRHRLQEAGNLPAPLRLRRRRGLARRRDPDEIAHRAQARGPGDRRRGHRRRIRQTAPRPQALRIRAVVPEPKVRKAAKKLGVYCSLHGASGVAAPSSPPSTTRAICARSSTRAFPFDQTLEALTYVESGKVKAGRSSSRLTDAVCLKRQPQKREKTMSQQTETKSANIAPTKGLYVDGTWFALASTGRKWSTRCLPAPLHGRH